MNECLDYLMSLDEEPEHNESVWDRNYETLG